MVNQLQVIMHENPSTGSVFTPVPGSNFSKVRLSVSGDIVVTDNTITQPTHSVWMSIDNKVVKAWEGLDLKEGSVFPLAGGSKRQRSFKPFYYDKNGIPQKPDQKGEGGDFVLVEGKQVYHQDVFVFGGEGMSEEWVSNDNVTATAPANPTAVPLELGTPVFPGAGA